MEKGTAKKEKGVKLGKVFERTTIVPQGYIKAIDKINFAFYGKTYDRNNFLTLAAIEFLRVKPWLDQRGGFQIPKTPVAPPKPLKLQDVGLAQLKFFFQPANFHNGRALSGEQIGQEFDNTLAELKENGYLAHRKIGKPLSLSDRTFNYAFLNWLIEVRFAEGAPSEKLPLTIFKLKDDHQFEIGGENE